MPIRALENIRHSGVTYMSGDLIRGLSDSDKKRLLGLKSAEEVVTVSEIQEIVQDLEVDPALFKELRDALDENYNADELKRVAKKVGVQFDSRDLKEKVMEAVIKQGKADELLEDDDGE